MQMDFPALNIEIIIGIKVRREQFPKWESCQPLSTSVTLLSRSSWSPFTERFPAHRIKSGNFRAEVIEKLKYLMCSPARGREPGRKERKQVYGARSELINKGGRQGDQSKGVSPRIETEKPELFPSLRLSTSSLYLSFLSHFSALSPQSAYTVVSPDLFHKRTN